MSIKTVTDVVDEYSKEIEEKPSDYGDAVTLLEEGLAEEVLKLPVDANLILLIRGALEQSGDLYAQFKNLDAQVPIMTLQNNLMMRALLNRAQS